MTNIDLIKGICPIVAAPFAADESVDYDSPAAASITGADIVMDGGARLLSDKGEKYGFAE